MPALSRPRSQPRRGWKLPYSVLSVCGTRQPQTFQVRSAYALNLDHIHMYMHPQALIIDTSSDEEAFLGRGAQQHVKATGSTLIELPRNSGKTLEWMTKLDSAALRSKPHTSFIIYTQV